MSSYIISYCHLPAQRTVMLDNLLFSAHRTIMLHHIILSPSRTLYCNRTIIFHDIVNNMLTKYEYYILNMSCNCGMSNRIVIIYVNKRLHYYLKNINYNIRDNNIIRKFTLINNYFI